VSTQTALTPTFHRKPPPAPILVEQPVEPREPVETKPISKPKVKRPPPAAKPQSKPKETPAADRSRLLNLMREPTDR
jgi:outer membrane biosynthesis protein TonB